jgi:hypothetical protein
MTRVIASGGRSQPLRGQLARKADVSPHPFALGGRHAIEFLDAAETHRLHALAWELLKGWPDSYISNMREAGVWAAWATRDLFEVPFILHQVVDDNLRLDVYSPPFSEVLAAVQYLAKNGRKVSGRRLNALIGESQYATAAISALQSPLSSSGRSRPEPRRAAGRRGRLDGRDQPPSRIKPSIARAIRSE